MQKPAKMIASVALCTICAFAAEKSLAMPELKVGEIKNINKEVENGVTQYEIESVVNGKHRDFRLHHQGRKEECGSSQGRWNSDQGLIQ